MNHEPVNLSNIGALAISRMQEQDVASYCLLFQRIFAQAPWNETWPLEKIRQEVRKTMGQARFFGLVANCQSQPVGYLTGYGWRLAPVGPWLFYLEQLFVADAFQGAGIGQKLLAEVLALAQRQPYRGIVLLTQPGSPAERFYRRQGFKPLLPIVRCKGKIWLWRLLARKGVSNVF